MRVKGPPFQEAMRITCSVTELIKYADYFRLARDLLGDGLSPIASNPLSRFFAGEELSPWLNVEGYMNHHDLSPIRKYSSQVLLDDDVVAIKPLRVLCQEILIATRSLDAQTDIWPSTRNGPASATL